MAIRVSLWRPQVHQNEFGILKMILQFVCGPKQVWIGIIHGFSFGTASNSFQEPASSGINSEIRRTVYVGLHASIASSGGDQS